MRFIDAMILVCGLIGVITWAIFSGKDGFKGNNAIIVARSLSVSATMEGYVDNSPPIVGTKFDERDLLVRIHNGRIDRTRLADFESQMDYLESEIVNVDSQQHELATLLKAYEERADSYAKWKLEDFKLRKAMNMQQLDVARMRSRIKDKEVQRLTRLLKKQHASEVNVQVTKTESQIARSRMELAKVELQRSALLLRSLQGREILSEDGDPNYWAKMANDLRMRFFDNRGKIALLRSQLSRAIAQTKSEQVHIDSNFTEEHRAPFSGVVNATFVTNGARVASGTSLLQVLDCTRPTVIIPIPDHRIGEFAVGMKATVYPVDSPESLHGTITHISSGPLLSHDSTIQLEQQLTLKGNRAIVGFDDNQMGELSTSCETSRKAVAVIHTGSMYETISKWVSESHPRLAWIGHYMDVQAADPPSPGTRPQSTH